MMYVCAYIYMGTGKECSGLEREIIKYFVCYNNQKISCWHHTYRTWETKEFLLNKTSK